MDANKRDVLIEIGYKVTPACGTCQFAELKGEWGNVQSS